jgi:hypothetical protein
MLRKCGNVVTFSDKINSFKEKLALRRAKQKKKKETELQRLK